VKCETPLVGTEIQLTTTTNNYLQISGVEVFGWSGESKSSSTSTTKSTGSVSTTPANTKLSLKGAS